MVKLGKNNNIDLHQSKKLWGLMDDLRGSMQVDGSLVAILAVAVIAKIAPEEFSYIYKLPKSSQREELLSLMTSHTKLNQHRFDILNNALLTASMIQAIIYFIHEIKDFSNFADVILDSMSSFLGKRGESTTDSVIIEIVKKLVGNISDEKVYDSAAGLCALTSQLNTAELVLEDINLTSKTLGTYILILKGKNAEYTLNNSLLKTRPSAKADLVVTQPPWGLRFTPNDQAALKSAKFLQFDKDGRIPASAGDALWIQHALYNMNETGKAIMLMPQGWLFRGGYDAKLRAHLLENDYIEAIIGLPAGLLSTTGIPSVILVLNKNKSKAQQGVVNFVDAGQLGSQDKRKKKLNVDEINLIVSLAEGEKHDHELFQAILLPEIHQNDNSLNIKQYIQHVDEIEMPNLQKESENLEKIQATFVDAQSKLMQLLAK